MSYSDIMPTQGTSFSHPGVPEYVVTRLTYTARGDIEAWHTANGIITAGTFRRLNYAFVDNQSLASSFLALNGLEQDGGAVSALTAALLSYPSPSVAAMRRHSAMTSATSAPTVQRVHVKTGDLKYSPQKQVANELPAPRGTLDAWSYAVIHTLTRSAADTVVEFLLMQNGCAAIFVEALISKLRDAKLDDFGPDEKHAMAEAEGDHQCDLFVARYSDIATFVEPTKEQVGLHRSKIVDMMIDAVAVVQQIAKNMIASALRDHQAKNLLEIPIDTEDDMEFFADCRARVQAYAQIWGSHARSVYRDDLREFLGTVLKNFRDVATRDSIAR